MRAIIGLAAHCVGASAAPASGKEPPKDAAAAEPAVRASGRALEFGTLPTDGRMTYSAVADQSARRPRPSARTVEHTSLYMGCVPLEALLFTFPHGSCGSANPS